jgi:hypothetical protein
MSVFMDVHRCMMVHFHNDLFSGIPTRKPASWPAGIKNIVNGQSENALLMHGKEVSCSTDMFVY